MTLSENEINKIQNDIVFHIEEIQGIKTLEPYQKRICEAVSNYDRVVISACHDVGKTFTLSRIVLALGSSFPGCKIITTAPTFLQVEKLLWAEIRSGFRDSATPLGGSMLNVEWKISPDWFALGTSPKDDAGSGEGQGTGSRFQGFHGDMVVIIFDEATGVHPKRWVQAEGMLTSANTKFIAIGNPTSRSSEFFKCFSNPLFKKIKISCFDSPNLIENGVSNLAQLKREADRIREITDDDERLDEIKNYKVVQPKLITMQWVINSALRWGFEHPLFISKVLGQFPDEDSNAIVKMHDVETAQNREASTEGGRFIGVDPAHFGTDSTVITVIEGNEQTQRIELTKADTSEVTGRIVRLINSLERRQNEVVVIDATGIGAGVSDQLRERRRDGIIPESTLLRPVHFGAQVPIESEKKTYSNLKAKLFVELGQDLKNELSILPDSVYLEELPTIIYKFDSRGRYQIESKDDYKKRTGRGSPDNSDSLALANYGRKSINKVGSFAKMSGATGGAETIGTLVNSGGSNNW